MVWAIEGYELLAEVGQGETGLIISARDSATGASVAIRYLTQDMFEMPGYFRLSITATDEMVERAIPVFEKAISETR